MRKRVRDGRARGHRYAQPPVSCARRSRGDSRCLLLLLVLQTEIVPAGKHRGGNRGRSEDAGPLLRSRGGRVRAAEQVRREHWASAREREPAVFAAGPCGELVRRGIGGMSTRTGVVVVVVGWAMRAAQGREAPVVA